MSLEYSPSQREPTHSLFFRGRNSLSSSQLMVKWYHNCPSTRMAFVLNDPKG